VSRTDNCFVLQDERYSADEQQYDWYQDFKGLERYLSPYLKHATEFEILIPGCGNSSKLNTKGGHRTAVYAASIIDPVPCFCCMHRTQC
jgi:hypothetical protein